MQLVLIGPPQGPCPVKYQQLGGHLLNGQLPLNCMLNALVTSNDNDMFTVSTD